MDIARILARFLLLRTGLLAGALVAFRDDLTALQALDSDSKSMILRYQQALMNMAQDNQLVVRCFLFTQKRLVTETNCSDNLRLAGGSQIIFLDRFAFVLSLAVNLLMFLSFASFLKSPEGWVSIHYMCFLPALLVIVAVILSLTVYV